MKVLTPAFFNRDTATVARELLGCLLVRNEGGVSRVGRIVETEAYLGRQDKASHSSRGMTPRNQVMFGPPGHAYVYLVYGMHCCMNAVTESAGIGSAVLIRALEPIENIEGPTHGPGRLCKAMGIDRTLNGAALTGPDLCIQSAPEPPRSIVRRPRIGVDYAGPRWAGRLLRFYIRNHPYISRA